MISFYAQNIPFKFVGKQIIKNWIKEVVTSCESRPGNLNFIFMSDDDLLQINKKFLNHNFYTDVITFDTSEYSEPNEPLSKKIDGDIYISLDTVLANSREYSASFTIELYRVMIHGVLHLLGYDDLTEEQKEVMRKAEDFSLSQLQNIFPEYPLQNY